MKSKLVLDMSNEDYHAGRSHFSSSALKTYLRDPVKFYQTYITNEIKNKPTEAMDLGTYIHALILEPETVERDFAFFDGVTRRGKAYDEFALANTGKVIITPRMQYTAQKVMECYNKKDKIKELITGGVPEASVFTELQGFPIKVRFDYVRNNTVYDVKTTTASLTKEAISKTIASFDYDLSAALYVDALKEYRSETSQGNFFGDYGFVFIFVSKDPVEIKAFKASSRLIENGRAKYCYAIDKLKTAQETGIYYSDEIEEIDIPEYALWN